MDTDTADTAVTEERRELEEIYRALGIPLDDARTDPSPEEDGAPSPAELVASARRFHRRLRVRLNEALEATGISYAQFEVLEALNADPNHHTGSIAQLLGITRQSAHDLVRKLEAAGFVERLPPDSGVRGVRLTSDGGAKLSRCVEALEPFRLMFGRLQPDSRRSLAQALIAAEATLRPPPRWSI